MLDQLTQLCQADDRGQWLANALAPLPVQTQPYPGGTNYLLLPEKPIRVLFVAHHDKVAPAPGANDNGAACVILLQAAKELFDPQGDVGFAWVDNEEPCNRWKPVEGRSVQMGSKVFADLLNEKVEISDPAPYVVVLDVCGKGEMTIVSKSYPCDQQTRDLLYTAAKQAQVELTDGNSPWSDNVNFPGSALVCCCPKAEWDAGRKETWAKLHTVHDSVEGNCDLATMERVKRLVCQIARTTETEPAPALDVAANEPMRFQNPEARPRFAEFPVQGLTFQERLRDVIETLEDQERELVGLGEEAGNPQIAAAAEELTKILDTLSAMDLDADWTDEPDDESVEGAE